jgi:hypothetical protein
VELGVEVNGCPFARRSHREMLQLLTL